MILADDVLEHKSPKLYYVVFPRVPPTGCEDMHRGVCATDGGRLLKFVDVVANNQQRRNDTIFTYTLTKTEAGRMEWVMDAAAPMTAKERWGLEAPAPVPHEVPM
ncbi:hypothetical protein C2845_PM14G21080 [Panicum miliaceum]|uniref:DUF1618 domain-containing protein n=1 Tax=Panicum miliaceum TaxID=4540 RepID=A0A3L6PSY9_PANMI|nr:hypothetical protein C2845_PM14G21080 [Panicum miliaceum]